MGRAIFLFCARAREWKTSPSIWYFHRLAWGIALGVFVVGQLLRLVRPAQMSIWTEIVICIGVGVCFGYYVPFLNRLAPARVWTNDRGLQSQEFTLGRRSGESAFERCQLRKRCRSNSPWRFPTGHPWPGKLSHHDRERQREDEEDREHGDHDLACAWFGQEVADLLADSLEPARRLGLGFTLLLA